MIDCKRSWQGAAAGVRVVLRRSARTFVQALRRSARTYAQLLLAAGAVLLVGGCASTVTSDVTVFHQWPADATRTFRIAASPEQLESLEHADYRRQLRAELARLGFVESGVPRFEVRLDPQVVSHSGQRVDVAYPYYVQPWFGWGYWGSSAGFSMAMPWPGWGGGYAVQQDYLWYEYRLSVEFRDLAANDRRVFEGKAATAGGSPSIAAAMPYLLRAVFADFPGLSGITRRVEIPEGAGGLPSGDPAQGGAVPGGTVPANAPQPSGSSAPPPGGPPMR